MDLLNIDNHSQTLLFKTFKRLLYICYPKFVKTFKKHPNNKSDIRQFPVLLYDCVPDMKSFYSIDRLLKNVNVLQIGTGKNSTTPFYSEHFLNKENIKITKKNMLLKVLQVFIMLKF